MLPKMGKTFPPKSGPRVDHSVYRNEISAALKRELGGSHRAIKSAMRWTGVAEKTAKNWIAGIHGPAGEHLIELMSNSDEVLQTVLKLSDNTPVYLLIELGDLRSTLDRMLATLDEVLGDKQRNKE